MNSDEALFTLPSEEPAPLLFASPATVDDVVGPGWAGPMASAEPQLHELAAFLQSELDAGRPFLPSSENILRAFQQPLEQVRVLIVGQDPYPTPGHSVGLAFAVNKGVRPLPRSLNNIYRELATDVGISTAPHGDLSGWTRQGVLLLNRCLTVGVSDAGSHRNRGWENVTDLAVRALVTSRRRTGQPMAAILWGRDAQKLAPLLEDIPTVESVHPSPLSAARGFFGSRPFSRVNEMLVAQGGDPVDWRLDP
ncbi:uracil-DNA glycosylase [Arthrobacter roseus]|uniref:uracil-DNA glycosylase n=1 Tax=Arthrobacter roseus TaxID=136274 RepID=UPI00196429AD|nr:uracil-DNA glycosylase [Arthrobacter roseus]